MLNESDFKLLNSIRKNKNKSLSKVGRIAGMTPGTVIKKKTLLKKMKLIDRKILNGRANTWFLTDKGNEVLDCLLKIDELLE